MLADLSLPISPLHPVAETFDAVVLGAGISGLVAASVLLGQGARRVLVVDEYDHVGGNHIDWSKDGYTFDVGSLIFQDDSPLLRHFPELTSLYVEIDPSWGRLNPQGMVTAYPISVRDDILRAGPLEIARMLMSLARARLFGRRLRNARDFARFWIGQHLLQRSGLESYMRRFYGVAPEEIDVELAHKRMGWISEHARLAVFARRLLLARKPAPRSNRQMARPRAGFAPLYAVAVERLQAGGAHFRLSTQVRSIVRRDGVFTLDLGGESVSCNRLVSTIPIHRAQQMCGLGDGRHLESVTLISLYFSFAGQRGFAQPIIYNFSHEGAWKRLTVYSDFYGRANGREYFGVEVVGHYADNSIDKAEADFRRHMRQTGLFDGDLVLEGAQLLDNAYPIYRGNAAQCAAEAVAALAAFGVESIGRQGAFNYQPTARVTTLDAETALRRGEPAGDSR